MTTIKLTADFSEEKTPILDCSEISSKLSKYGVMTTHKSVCEALAMCSTMPYKMQTKMLKQCHIDLTQWSNAELQTHYVAKNHHWYNFCNDTLLFYTLRFILLKIEIPIWFMED